MPRHFIKRFLPDPRRLRRHRSLRFLGERLHQTNLWHLNRRSVAGGLALGVFVAFIPIPGQMVVAALASLWLGVNLPLAVATVWITNPITIPPIFYFTYRLGSWLLDSRPLNIHFELSIDWFLYNMSVIWQPLLLGSLVIGALLACLAYWTVSLTWRWYILMAWRKRHKQSNKKRNKQQNTEQLGSQAQS